jgi:hypothetical protein
MDTAIPTVTSLGRTPMVESCRCPEGHTSRVGAEPSLSLKVDCKIKQNLNKKAFGNSNFGLVWFYGV